MGKLTKDDLISIIEGDRRAKIHIQPYKGLDDDLDASDWISLYEILAEDAQWQDEQMIRNLPSYLRGVAIKWYFNAVRGKIKTWDSVVDEFIEHFGHNDRPSLAVINKMKWDSEKESLAKYYQHKLSICMRSGLKGPSLIDALTDGLPERYKVHVQTIDPNSKPQIWYNLVQRALDRENQKMNSTSFRGITKLNSRCRKLEMRSTSCED